MSSRFFEEAVLLALEVAALPYAIAGRLPRLLQAGVYGVAFRPFAGTLGWPEPVFQVKRSGRVRWIIVVREVIADPSTALGCGLSWSPGTDSMPS